MDVIAEFITRIRNAAAARQDKFDVPSSNLRSNIAEVLRSQGYIKNFKVVRDGKQGMMRVYLKYGSKGESAIAAIHRVSRPGRRYYVKADEIPQVRSGFGTSILSTSRGIMSGSDARKENLGGELLIKIW